MIRLGIIGAGTIFQNYIVALSRFPDKYMLFAVYDSNIDKLNIARSTMADLGLSKDVLYYNDFENFMESDIDVVVIATPPKTHFQLAIDCLSRKKSVLIEKPMVLSIDRLYQLYECARCNDVLIHVAYHASFATDLQWYLDNRSMLSEKYGFKRLSRIFCGFYDPYMIDDKMLSQKAKLEGSYIDSGVNELSVCDRIVDLDGFLCIKHNQKKDKNGILIESNSFFSNGKTSLILDTGWVYNLNRKRTVLQFEDCEKQLVLDHSNQRVIIQPLMTYNSIISSFHNQEEIEINRDNELLFEDISEQRLNRHYMGVFSNYEQAYAKRLTNERSTVKIHKLLFENI